MSRRPRETGDKDLTRATAPDILGEVNDLHASDWRLENRLSGGYQSGAYRLSDPHGGAAVLKWTDDRGWAGTVVAAGPVVDALRQRGWPTPAWLAYGVTHDGFPYQVQEFVAGSTQERITVSWLDLVLPRIRDHAGLATEQMRDWSRYDPDVVFRGRDGCRTDVAGVGADGVALVATISRVCAPFVEVELPSDDLVHGDLNPENVLLAEGRLAAFVDVEALGRGTRVHDLANLLLYATLWGEPEGVAPLEAECRAVASAGVLEISLSAVTLTLLQFGTRHWPADDVALACRQADGLLRRLAG